MLNYTRCVFATLLIFGGISQNSFSGGAPLRAAEKAENPNFSDTQKPTERFQHLNAELQKVVAEIESEQERHKESLENIKKDLQQIESHSDAAKESQKNLWVPSRIAWVVDKDEK